MAVLKPKPTKIGKTEKTVFFKTDLRSVFGLMKTDRFLFPAGLYQKLVQLNKIKQMMLLDALIPKLFLFSQSD
jgi:hypothetical protein